LRPAREWHLDLPRRRRAGAAATPRRSPAAAAPSSSSGLYKINKRIRRDFFIIDEERGVAVGRGFFDHANEWDHYLLTNGREMRTALKWPNSISLLEAFRIRDGKIARIEAVFTYVPYFMHNPFWGPPSSRRAWRRIRGPATAACVARQHQRGHGGLSGAGQWASLPWAERGRLRREQRGIRINEGIWQGVTAVDANPLWSPDARPARACGSARSRSTASRPGQRSRSACRAARSRASTR
jgi:hypothetical protein